MPMKTVFDELNVALTLDWDQKNQEFYKTQLEVFAAKVGELQKQGLTNAQLMSFIKTQMKDERAAKDMEATLNIISLNRMTPSEASKYRVSAMEQSYGHGVSWTGTQIFVAASALLIIAATAVVLVVNDIAGPKTCGWDEKACGVTCQSAPSYFCEANYCCR